MKPEKHTPGPWHISFCQKYGGTKSATRIVDEDGDLICEGLDWNKNGEADARLIAAAPRLLSALIRLVDAFNGDSIHGVDFAMEDAGKAIAEATGKGSYDN